MIKLLVGFGLGAAFVYAYPQEGSAFVEYSLSVVDSMKAILADLYAKIG